MNSQDFKTAAEAMQLFESLNFAGLERLKKDIPFSKRLNQWIVNWYEDKKHIFKFVKDDDFETGPEYFNKLKSIYYTSGTINIWNGASELTIYGNGYINKLFRCWHDYIHITNNLDFEPINESIVCELQKAQLPKNWIFEKMLLHAEVTGQTQYYHINEDFVKDQRKFTINYLKDVNTALRLNCC